jgi:hypothetical protein
VVVARPAIVAPVLSCIALSFSPDRLTDALSTLHEADFQPIQILLDLGQRIIPAPQSTVDQFQICPTAFAEFLAVSSLGGAVWTEHNATPLAYGRNI